MHVPGKPFLSVPWQRHISKRGWAPADWRKWKVDMTSKEPSWLNLYNFEPWSPENSGPNCRKLFVSLPTWNVWTRHWKSKSNWRQIKCFSSVKFFVMTRNAFVKSEASHENRVRRYVVSIDLSESDRIWVDLGSRKIRAENQFLIELSFFHRWIFNFQRSFILFLI